MSGQSQHFAYLFEAKGIQRYILDSGPLRDLVGASDLVAGLAGSGSEDQPGGDLLGAVISAAGAEGQVEWSRRAGGSFMLHAQSLEPLERVRSLWRLVAGLRCPGLEMSDVLLTGSEARDTPVRASQHAYESGTTIRFNTAAELPPTGHPFAAINQRTGRLTTGFYRYKDGFTEVDVVTQAHRDRAQYLARNPLEDTVARKFLPSHGGNDFVFPRNLDPDEGDVANNPLFPFRERGVGGTDHDRRIAVIHADISGLAQTFSDIAGGAKDIDGIWTAARKIEGWITAAAKHATAEVLLPNADTGRMPAVVPARPIVLGGDDLTIIVRADLALDFTQVFLEHLEQLSKDFPSPGRHLSACAGIALVRAGQPFQMANDLAEDLCGFAKAACKAEACRRNRPTGPYASMIAFHNAQSTLQEEYGQIVAREMTTAAGALLTANPYAVGELADEAPVAQLSDVRELAQALADAPRGRGKLIEASRLLFKDPAQAGAAWDRWREVLGREALTPIEEVLAKAVGRHRGLPDAWPARPLAGLVSDALELVDFGMVEPAPASAKVVV